MKRYLLLLLLLPLFASRANAAPHYSTCAYVYRGVPVYVVFTAGSMLGTICHEASINIAPPWRRVTLESVHGKTLCVYRGARFGFLVKSTKPFFGDQLCKYLKLPLR